MAFKAGFLTFITKFVFIILEMAIVRNKIYFLIALFHTLCHHRSSVMVVFQYGKYIFPENFLKLLRTCPSVGYSI